MTELNFHKKRRGVTRASLTKLGTKITDLEASRENPNTIHVAQGLATKLSTLDADFKTHHLAIIDLTDGEEALGAEQKTLDDHDDVISELSVRIQQLVSSLTPSSTHDLEKSATRRLARLQEKLTIIEGAINEVTMDDEDGVCTIEQYAEQVADLKTELNDVQASLHHVELGPEDPLPAIQDMVEQSIFRCSLAVKKRLRPTVDTHATIAPKAAGAKLPKLEVPTFDGDILKWRSFWDQFQSSIHDRSDLTPAEKMVYLQNTLKDNTAKRTIEGLTKSGEHYEEAIKCLQARYNRPRLIHQTHVRRIIDAPSLKEGNGKELRILHDTVVQHLRALQSLEYELPPQFITSLLELKLDANTMFEWQRHSQEHNDVPDCKELLGFLDLRAQAAEASVQEKKPSKASYSTTKTKMFPSLAVSTRKSDEGCVACKGEKHPLYSCPKFRSMSHDEMVALLKANDCCLNCLRPGHFVKECKSLHHCKHCQRPHHSLLHVDNKASKPSAQVASNSTVALSNHASVQIQSNLLLMTCQVFVEAPHGVTKVRALLDSGSSASFVTERVAQSLLLRRYPQNAKICGITGLSSGNSTQSATRFKIASVYSPSKKFEVSAIVVPHVTCHLPVSPVSVHSEWDHIKGLRLADPDFNKPGRIDMLLGVETFVDVVRQGRRRGCRDSPTAIETEFGWVLAGSTGHSESHAITSHHVSVQAGDEVLRRFWEIEERFIADSTMSPEERAVMSHFRNNHSRDPDGRFVVPLPKRPTTGELGESRSHAVRRFISFEKSMQAKGQAEEVSKVMDEYFINQHAEQVPRVDLEKSPDEVFYLPVQVVHKDSSTTTKL